MHFSALVIEMMCRDAKSFKIQKPIHSSYLSDTTEIVHFPFTGKLHSEYKVPTLDRGGKNNL